MTKTLPTIHEDITAWKNFVTATGEKATAKKSVISFLTVSGLNSMPTGYCIHEFATKIHQADMAAPMPVSQVEARWNFLPTLFHPKNITATKVASMKNASMPSIARGAPKMSPTNQE